MPRGKYKRTKETRQKTSESLKGNVNSKGCEAWNKGIKVDRIKYPNMGHFKTHTKKTKIKMSKSHNGKCGKDSPSWKGGRKLSIARNNSKRKQFGFIPLNNPEVDGWVAHHLDLNYIIYIPEELHKSIYHSMIKDINMDIINDTVYKWFVGYYLFGNYYSYFSV